MSMRPLQSLTLSLSALLLAGCEVASDETAAAVVENRVDRPQVRVLSDAEVYAGSASAESRRIIPDLLYEALQALNADRLLTPVDDNAHARFKRVLALEPGNQIAVEGLQDIVERYLELTQQAMRRGQFEEAAQLLDRARFVDASHPEIETVAAALQREMNSGDLFFVLDYPEYAARSEAAQRELADIARQTREQDAFFLIVAPNDELARWMVSVMREAVSGYRLRGNIELSSRLGIRLRLPEGD